MKTYRKTALVQAKIFEKGDEDGMSCIPLVNMCKWKNSKGIYKDCGNCELDIPKQPYIIEIENDKFFGIFGEQYICTGNDGESWLVRKDIFERTYEEYASQQKDVKTKEEILSKHGFIDGVSIHSFTHIAREKLYAAMEEYTSQQKDVPSNDEIEKQFPIYNPDYLPSFNYQLEIMNRNKRIGAKWVRDNYQPNQKLK